MQSNNMTISVVRESKVKQTARVKQVSSMFDLPVTEKNRESWDVDLPIDFDWNIGLIVGPSGSGKTTIASELFPGKIIDRDSFSWDRGNALVDDFPKEMTIKDICKILGSVGFGSPPSWTKPFHVLSNGEQFRAFVARAMAESKADVIVIDEFTSVVDRQVAKIASHSVQKMIRKRKGKIICLSCHYDITEWLQPDWIYEPSSGIFQRGCLRPRPKLQIEIYPVSKAVWPSFSKYHYLSPKLHPAAKCYGAFIEGKCIAFISYKKFPHPTAKNIMKGHRLVVHPDYQGLGLGGILTNWRGEYLTGMGYRSINTTTHPALIHFYNNSPKWVRISKGKPHVSRKSTNKNNASLKKHAARFTMSRNSYSYEYIPS